MKFKSYQEDIPEDLLEYYQRSGLIAVDTETSGLNPWRDQVFTVQISDGLGIHTLCQLNQQFIAENIRKLLESESVTKVFHNALFDVVFLHQASINVQNFYCTKVMSKVVRTYTGDHSLKALSEELLDIKRDKKIRNSCFFLKTLNDRQIRYAIEDVSYLIQIYQQLCELCEQRGLLPSGKSCAEVNEHAQIAMRNLVPLIVGGFGKTDPWDISEIFRY